MNQYRVRWDIELDAPSPEEAAQKALEIQRDPNSWATCFTVYELDEHGQIDPRVVIDLDLGVPEDYGTNY